MNPLLRRRAVNRRSIPAWLREVPAAVLDDPPYLRAWLDARGLPWPSAAHLREELAFRAFVTAEPCAALGLRTGA